MPAAMTVSPEMIAKGAAQLVAEGKPITGWTLRRVIRAGRPSRLFAVWTEQQGAAPADALPEPEAPTLPPAISEHLAAATERLSADLTGLVAQSWARASDLATRRVQEEVDQARARVASLEAELVRAEGELEKADDEQRALSEELLRITTDRDAAAVVHAEEMAKAKDEAMRARADADAARGMLQHLQETVTELVARVPTLPQGEQPKARRRGRHPGRRVLQGEQTTEPVTVS